MMVSPRPDIAGLADAQGNWPANLFGTYETWNTSTLSVLLIKEILPRLSALRQPTISRNRSRWTRWNASRAYVKRKAGPLIKRPVNNSNETQLVVAAFAERKADAFLRLYPTTPSFPAWK